MRRPSASSGLKAPPKSSLLAPSVAVFSGWHWLFGPKMFVAWVADVLFAYAFGAVFQCFAIKPRRGTSNSGSPCKLPYCAASPPPTR